MNEEKLYFVIRNGKNPILWGPFVTVVEARNRIHGYCDIEYKKEGYARYCVAPDDIFEIIEVPISKKWKVKYSDESKASRVETLTD